MGSRAYIAKINPTGAGQYIYLGHGCYPNDAGVILLEHYQEEETVDALIALGSITNLATTPERTPSYHRDYDEPWEHCRPEPIRDGSQEFFGYAYQPGPELLYAWTPDGWLAARVQGKIPKDYFKQLSTLTSNQFQHWYDRNQQPQWTAWREQARRTQQPRPLYTVIQEYLQRENATTYRRLHNGPNTLQTLNRE